MAEGHKSKILAKSGVIGQKLWPESNTNDWILVISK